MSALQGDGRTFSYVAALSSDDPPQWDNIFALAKIIPKILITGKKLPELVPLFVMLMHVSWILIGQFLVNKYNLLCFWSVFRKMRNFVKVVALKIVNL